MTIAEAGKKYDLTPDTLRYYEHVGLIPIVGRTSGGIRDYSDDDCRWIEFIKCMRMRDQANFKPPAERAVLVPFYSWSIVKVGSYLVRKSPSFPCQSGFLLYV